MTIVSTLMFAFHGMIFSKAMRNLYLEMGIFIVLIGLASFFIIGIIVWLVHYIVNFMMDRRSKEFGTYLLLGMNRKQIIKVFKKENYLLAVISLLVGLLPGYLFQMLFIKLFYTILKVAYKISLDISILSIGITICVILLANFIGLKRVQHKIRKMSILDFMSLNQKNEEVNKNYKRSGVVLLFLSVIYMLLFNAMILFGKINLVIGLILSLLLIAAVYFLYMGLSAFFIRFIQKKSPIIYKRETLFIFRQLASKIKTMRFTMGTLTVLFTGSLLSWMVVMMFYSFQKTQITHDLLYDVIIFSADKKDSFKEELSIINENSEINDKYRYSIYQNKSTEINDYLYESVDGTKKGEKVKDKWTTGTYFGYDTYMKLSDYNHLRSILGYQQVKLNDDMYLIHGKKRLETQWKELHKKVPITINKKELKLKKINMEPFVQNGLNGADYLIVVPDSYEEYFEPYYSMLTVDLKNKAPKDLQEKLESAEDNYFEDDRYGSLYRIAYGHGSNKIIAASGTILVKDNHFKVASFVTVSICFMMAYLGIIFLCAALTVLAVQQLSDSIKHKKRYKILTQLGLNKREIKHVILKQLGIYYLLPYLISICLSIFIGLYAGDRFVYYTGVQVNPVQFYLISLAVFSAVYFLYFISTSISYASNINK